jgi:hypothetical protein
MAVIASIVLGAELRWRGPKAPVTCSSTTPNQYQSKENLNIPLAPMPGGRSHITRLLTYYSILTHPYLDGSRDSRASAVRLTRAAELLTDEKRPQRWQKLLGPFLLLTVSDVWRSLPAAGSCASDRSASAVHDAMASIATRAARRATSKSSMSGAVASTIALATRSMRSGVAAEPAVTIAAKLFATFAQNLPKAALQRPAKGTSIGSPGAPASPSSSAE